MSAAAASYPKDSRSAWAAVVPKVCRIIPILGSPVDGEVLAGGRALDRLLTGARLDLHFLAARIAGEPWESTSAVPAPQPAHRPTRCPRSSVFTEKQSAEHHEMARWCLDNDRGRLKPKDRKLLVNIVARRFELSIDQADWLVGLTDHFDQEDR